MEFWAWAKLTYPTEPILPFERMEGARQDITFDGSVPLYFNRKIVLEFLNQLVVVPGAENKLEKAMWRGNRCNEMVAQLRANTLWKFVFSEPMRWLAGKAVGLDGWGLDDQSRVMDAVEQLMITVAADGSTLFDPDYDPYCSFARSQSTFRAWQKQRMERKVESADGQEHPINKLVLAEARDPACAGNQQATKRTIELLELMATAALDVMRCPKRAICDLLLSQDGKFSAGKDPKRNTATQLAVQTNDAVEGNFGCLDLVMRMFRYATSRTCLE